MNFLNFSGPLHTYRQMARGESFERTPNKRTQAKINYVNTFYGTPQDATKLPSGLRSFMT